MAAAPPPPSSWLQFRLNDANNAVLPGNLKASWRIDTGGPFSSSPTLVNGVLYIGNNRVSRLYAIDPATGKIDWQYQAKDYIMSAAIVDNGLVYIGEGNENSPPTSTPSNPGYVGNGTNALLALDQRTGALRWSIPLHGSGMPSPAVLGNILVHHDGAGHLIGVNAVSGKLLYDRNLNSFASMVAAMPFADGTFVTAGVNDNVVFRLRARDGSTVWQHPFDPTDSALGDCPPVSDGRLIYCDYVGVAPDHTHVDVGFLATERVYALDAASGKLVWDTALETGKVPPRNEAGIPVLADGTLFVGGALSPYMHAIDPTTGRVKWRLKLHGPVKGGICARDGVIYFGDFGGYLWAVDDADGTVIGDVNEHTTFNVGSPLIDGQTLIIGTRGGSLMAVPLATIAASHDH